MLVSLNWLQEFVPFDVTARELAELLTLSGSEVESCTELGGELERVVVAQITAVSPHPNADKLSLCTVDSGGATHRIVCGARNIRPGDKAPLALDGTRLPGGITIKKSKIRGEVSEGMLCSETELLIGNDQSGVMILPPEAAVGQSLAEALGLRDVTLDVGLTPNRPDCLSILGIAREVAAITRKPLRIPAPAFAEAGEDISRVTSVTIEAPDLCPRYCARVITGVAIGPSPLWMRRRLEACGMRAINNIVDATNYVLLETGQPLHAFDLNLLEGKRIIVKRADPGTSFTTLDGKERTLPEDALMICDGSKQPVALAGIMGGLNSEVSPETKTILLESAYFSPAGILATSRTMGIRTEASQRFEKGVDPEGVIPAMNRAAELMAACAGGTVCPGIIDNRPVPPKPVPAITVSAARTNRVLGTHFSKEDIRQTLADLAFTVTDDDGDSISATPPSFRVDITESIDLIEEVARLRGYDVIAETLPAISPLPPVRDRARAMDQGIRDCLTQQGFNEILTYSFISPADLAGLNLPDEDPRRKPLTILNPLTEEQSCMRTTLVPGLLSAAQKNINQKNLNLKLFEVGPVFLPDDHKKLPREEKRVAGLLTGLYREETWNRQPREVDFFDIKGCVETLLRELRVSGFAFEPSHHSPFLSNRRALDLLLDQQRAGGAGELHPDVAKRYGLSQKIYLFELSLPHLLTRFTEERTFKALPKYPPVYRDIALLIDADISGQSIWDVIHRFKNKFIEEIKIFDYYKGASIPAGKKSLGYRIKYQSYDHTLTDREVNQWHEELVQVLGRELGAELRK
jgi:phenylalanyl-tRNA synthetase beta chain